MRLKTIIIPSILLTTFIILFMSLSSAQVQTLGIFKTDSCVNLRQVCQNCTYVNITSVIFPDSTIAVGQVIMDSDGIGYNFTFCNNSQNGEYIVNGIGDIDGINTLWAYNYFVNPLGKIFTNAEAILYTIIFFIAFILFILCGAGGLFMPSGNKKDEMTGYIIAVENMKYLKILLLSFSYIMLTLMVYFGWMISFGYLSMPFLGNLFNFAFYGLLILMLPLFIIGVFVIISNAIRDSKISEMLSRGLKVR